MSERRNWLVWVLLAAFCGPASAQEMVTNGTFDADLVGWSLGFDPAREPTDGYPDPNSGCARLDDNDTLNQWVQGFQAGKIYRMSFALKATDQGTNYYGWVRFSDAGGDSGNHIESEFVYNGASTFATLYHVPAGDDTNGVGATTEWVEHVLYMIPGETAVQMRLYLWGSGTTNTDILLDSISIQEVEEIPPVEMVNNGTFDNNLGAWTAPGCTWISADGYPEADGCAELSGRQAAGVNLNQWVAGFQAGQKYHMRFAVRSTTVNAHYYPFVRFHAGEDGAQVMSEFIYAGQSTLATYYALPNGDHVNANPGWISYELDMIPGSGATHLRVYFTGADSDTHFIRIDDVSITEYPVPKNCSEAKRTGYGLNGDIDGNCYVDLIDFSLLASDWARCVEPTDTACEAPWE